MDYNVSFLGGNVVIVGHAQVINIISVPHTIRFLTNIKSYDISKSKLLLAFPQFSVFKTIGLESYSCYLLQFDIVFFRERHIASIQQCNNNYVPATNCNNDTRSIISHSDFLLKHN